MLGTTQCAAQVLTSRLMFTTSEPHMKPGNKQLIYLNTNYLSPGSQHDYDLVMH